MAGQLDSQAASVSPVNVQEFAKKVKEKYPEYKDVDDLTLAQKIVEKYPEYKDRVSFDQPEESGQPKTYMENYLDERFPSQTKPEQTEISPTASLHSSLPYVNVDKGQIVPSVQEPKKQVSFDANAAPAIGQEKTVQQVIPQQQSKQEEYFEPAAQNVGGAQISSVQPEESLIFSTPEEEKIDLAKNIIDRSKRQANAVTGEGDNTGVGDALRDRNFWTLGSSDLSSMIYLKKIANKLEDGSPLTDGDKALLEAWNQSEQINQQYPASKANIWYKTGKNVTDMIPWLVQFAATRGTSATIRKGVETSLKKNAEKFLGANIAKGLSKGIAEVAGAYAAAAFMPNTYADITRRTLGQTYQDEQGNVKFDVSEADGNVKAIYKGWTNGMLEVLTERLGEGVTEGLKLLPKNKITSLLAGEAKGKAGKIFSDFTKSVGWNGVPLEYLEEWVNVPLNAMLVGDSKYSDMFDGKQQLETFLTVAAMGSAMGTAQMAANKYDAYKINRDYKSAKNLFNTDIDQQTRTTVESLVNSDIDIYDLSDQLDGVLASVDGEKAGIIMNYVIQSMKHSNFKQKPITTATIEGQQYTINNPEDLGQEGKPIFAKDAEGNVIPVQNHKVTNPVTQTVEQIDQANQQEAERVKLYAGISDPSAQITEEVNEDNIRLVSFSNGQSKIITPEGEVIANNEAEKDRILEAVVNGEPLPQPKVTDTGEVISPAPERKVITQKIGNTPIDIIEGEEFDEVVPTEKVPLDKALPVLEKKFKDIKDFKLEVEKVQVEEPGETKYDKPVKKTVIKSIKIVPVAKIGNIENVNQEKVSEIQQQAIEQQQIVNTEQPESSQKNQLQNEESKNVNGEVAGAAPQAEDTPQAEQGQGVNEGLEENVNTNESTVANVMAADYLFNGGVGVLGSSDYLIKSLTGAFAKASGLIEQIRQRYAREINDSNLGYIKDFVNTELYNKVMADIRNAINTSYNNNQEVIDIFDQILQYPTGLPVKLGTQLSIQLESINESAVPPVVGESFTPGDSAGQITEKQITEQEKINAKKARQQAKQVSPEEQKQRSINKAKALSIEPSTIEQLVLQYIVPGNRLNWDEIKREVFPRSDSEMKQRIWMLKKDAKTIDQLLGLLNGTTMEEEGNQPNAFRNAVIDAVLRNGTRTQMVDRILEIGDQNNNQQNIADYEQRMAEAAEAFEQEERNNELLAWEEYLTELENNGQLPTENELIELFLQDNTTTNEQAVNQAGNSEQDRPVNPEKNEGNGQVISGSKPGNDGKNAIKESPKELTPLEKEIQSLQKERAELLSKKVKTVKNVNARNGLFGDIAAQPNDLFAGQGFDATEAQRIIKSIDDRISVIDQTIEDLSAKNEQVKATSEKENAGQQEINIPDRTLEAKQVQDVAGQDSGQRPAVPQSPLSKVLSDGKKEVQEKKQNQKNAKFENQNNDNEIPESVSQRERTAQDQEDKRLEEVATRLADGISQSEGKGASSQRDTEARIVLDYAKENGLWINDIYDLGEHFSSGNESTVVVDVEKGVVYKSNNLMNSITISNLLQQIKIHNQLFPSTRYSLVGFTGIDNGVNRPPYIEVILSQPLINESVPANDIEINQYMKSLGFERTGDGVFSNGDYILRDIHPRNVLKDAAGDIYVIDNIIKPSEQKQQDSASFKEEAPKNDQQKQQDSASSQKPLLDVLKEGKEVVDEKKQQSKQGYSVPESFSLQSFDNYIKAFNNGEISLDQFKQAYQSIKSSKESLISELNSKTKVELLANMNAMGQYRYKNEKKDSIVKSLFDDMLMEFSFGSITFDYGRTLEQSIDDKVSKTTQEDIDNHVAEVKKQREEYAAKVQQYKKALSNPETLEEFKIFIKKYGIAKLSPEQKAIYDELVTDKVLDERNENAERKAVVEKVDTGEIEFSIVETKHTKTGQQLFVVKQSGRVSDETYKELVAKAKKLGGYYSSYSKDGATPGYIFKTKEAAEQFANINKENAVSTSADVKEEETTVKTVSKLRENAQKMMDKANEELGRNRLTNTAKRAREAASTEAKWEEEKRIAQTMLNIADAIENGDVKLLDGIKAKTHIQLLDELIRTAKYHEISAKSNGSYSERQKYEGEPATLETIEYLKNGFLPSFYASTLKDLINKAEDIKGVKNIASKWKKKVSGTGEYDQYQTRSTEEVDEISQMFNALSEKGKKYNRIGDILADFKRLVAMGIENDSMLRAALREYIQYRGKKQAPDKVKQLERAIVGRARNLGIDFFPTPSDVAKRMVDIAEINENMDVLEPSAGNGNIADQIKETGVMPDVIEISSELAEILKAKGYNHVADDFLTFNDKKYDRILMNPPFSNGLDGDHLQHAYDLLKPGGKVIAIIGEGTFTRSDKKAVAFREWLDEVGGTETKLEAGTFQDKTLLNTTGASARLVVIEKEGEFVEEPLDKEEQEVIADIVKKFNDVVKDEPVELDEESKPSEPINDIQDFGEKIGGARKDQDIKRTAKETDSMPAWRRKFNFANPDGSVLLISKVDTTKPFIVNWWEEVKGGLIGGSRQHFVTEIKDGYLTRTPMIFTSEQDAENYIPIYEAKRQGFKIYKNKEGRFVIYKRASNNKAIEFDSFDTQEEAETYLQSTEGATSLLNRKRETFNIPQLEKVQRTGKDYRKGKNIDADEFTKTFGFRGGEFGNWVKPEERQAMLNLAYDSFMDLANILNISPKAISLGGELSIAFGARGTGGFEAFNAHYESSRAVINLTRLKGAGALAHEWMHALDNYFGLQDANRDYSRDDKGELKTKEAFLSEIDTYKSGMRKELKDIFRSILSRISKKEVTRLMAEDVRQKAYDGFETSIKREADFLLTKLENGTRQYKYNRKIKQREEVLVKATPDQLKQAKELIEKITSGKSTRPEWKSITGNMLGEYSYVNEDIRAIDEIYKAVFGHTGLKRNSGDYYNLGYYAERLYYAKEQLDKAKSGEFETVKIKTELLENSEKFDASRVSPYFSKPLEMLARSFEQFVVTKLNEQGVRSDYLQYDKSPIYKALYEISPYPDGQDLTDLNKLFQQFFDTIQEKEENENVILFRISEKASKDVEGRPNLVKTLDKISSELGEPVNIINSEEIPPIVDEMLKKIVQDKNDLSAFFFNNQVFILSDKIKSVSDAVSSYIHETVIHKGLRNTFAQSDRTSIIGKQYAKLDDLFIDVFGSMSRSQKMQIANYYAPGLYENGKITRNPSADEKALIGEEFLAHVSENQEIYDAPVLSKWQEFINRLAQIIRKAFRLTSNQFSQKDLLDIIRESRSRLKDKAKGTTEESSRLRVTNETVSLGKKPNDMDNTILIDGVPRPTLNSKGLPIAQTEEGLRNFWKWFGDSKVVDAEGRPLVVYHGTEGDFNEFSLDHYSKSIDFGTAGKGFYFTSDPENAGNIARNISSNRGDYSNELTNENIMPVYLSIKNPKYGDPMKLSGDNKKQSESFTEKNKSKGFDGFIGDPLAYGKMYGNMTWFVAFNPSQIKSATGNSGSFSPETNDIRFRVESTVNELKNLTNLPKSKQASDLLKSVNETVEANMNESHGIKKMPLWDRIKQKLAEIKESTQHFKHITEKDFPEVYDKLRQFEAIPDRVKKEAFEKVSQIVRPLIKNEEHMKAFERYIVLQDLVHDIEETELFANKELPWGYNTIDEIKTDMRNVRSYVMRTPVILKAIRERQAMMKEIKKELVATKLLKDNGNDNYFHHQVLAFMDNRANVGVSAKDVRNHKKGWQRSRQGSIALYNTNYIESEFEVMAQSLEQLAIKNLLGEINEGINIMPKLVEKAKKEGGNWKDYIPDGYKYWFPKPGTNAYKAASMAEKAVRNILQDPDNPELQEILAEAEGSMWVIPEQVAKQLDEMKDREKEVIYAEMLRATTGKWKQWTLLNPFRAAKYNFNNMSGDLDIVLAYNPKILEKKYAHKSMTEALDEMRGKGMSEDMKEALKYGVITSGLSIQEIPDINSQSLFRLLTKGQGTWAKRAFGRTLGSYWAGVTAFTQFRENILRVAAYKFFKDQINAGKKPIGASKHDAIQALYASGVSANEIAGKLARELMGDYGNLSQAGQWLRAHSFPFWSWVEINAPRYYQMLKNTKFDGNSGVIGQVAGVGVKKTAVNVGMLAVRAMLMMALVVAWNRIFFPDEDDELQKLGDDKLKLIIGRREDGSIMTIKIQGAFSDVLSFFSLEDAVSDVKELREGKTTAGKKLAESGNAFVNKFAQGAMPMTRASMELAMGKSLYPDVFDPRTIRDRGEHATRLVSMDKLYNYLTHKPVRSYGKEVSSLLVYDNNPGEAAYYTMREKINEFLKDNEEDMPSSEPTDKSNALYYYKKSLKMGDEKTAKFWFEKYKELGGTAQGYKTSMKKGMLVNSVPKELRGKWLESLDAEDKEILDLANRWYLETYIKVGIPVNTKE